MSQQAINTTANYKERQTDGKDRARTLHGESLAVIRVDDLPKGEADRLAAEGKWYPVTCDKNGHLRVALPDSTKVEVTELEVLCEIRELLKENRDLLLKIA